MKAYKTFNFDLDTNKMKDLGVYPNGYGAIKVSMEKHKFIHRQESGYLSTVEYDALDITRIVRAVTKDNPWLKECANVFDVQDVPVNQYSVLDIIKDTKIGNWKNKGKDDGRGK